MEWLKKALSSSEALPNVGCMQRKTKGTANTERNRCELIEIFSFQMISAIVLDVATLQQVGGTERQILDCAKYVYKTIFHPLMRAVGLGKVIR
jgi:hypothetical protein